jgi:primosomal protein N' (replication factor Y) (superfamily II helicase)
MPACAPLPLPSESPVAELGGRVQVAVPVPQISGPLSYAVPAALAARCVPGVRVRVSVGGRKVVGLIVAEEGEGGVLAERLKLLEEVLDEEPIVTKEQLALCRFVSDYYLAPLGETVRLVLPPDTRRDVRRRYKRSDEGERALVFGAAHGLTGKDSEALARFEQGEHKSEQMLLRQGVGKARLRRLVERGLLAEVEERGAGVVRVEETLLALEGGQPLPARAPALEALDAWVRKQPAPPQLAAAQIVFPGARGKVKRLVELGRLRVHEETRSKGVLTPLSAPGAAKALTGAQQRAVDSILRARGEGERAFLLEGVTGSGKTEVYLSCLRAVLARGQGALLLVPEIALTPQLLARVRAGICAEVAVLHSGLTPQERRDALQRMREGSARVGLGARSALFAPVPDLGLIVVDEEHEPSLKQDETPRYHARDVALWRARSEGALCVLGSATPSLESRHNAIAGKLTRLVLPERLGGGGRLPTVQLVDLRARKQIREAKERDRPFSEGSSAAILSGPLVEAIEETLLAKEQVLLFLNRRGYASFFLCEACGEIRQCPHCSVSLTLHARNNKVLCHQCDYEEPVPEACGFCHATPLIALGLGTERVEAEVKARFPEAKVARLDRDTVRKKGELERVLGAVQRREVDVLIGTQMVAKGHDFPGIALVGVVLADVALGVPDFRAAERAFALITQVAGRAGRGERLGRVFVQTYNPAHPALQAARTHDVNTFVARELLERREARYPPFWRVALLRIEGLDPVMVDAMARRVGELLRALGQALGGERTSWDVLGPAPAPLERLRGMTRHQVFFRTLGVSTRGRLLAALQRDEPLQRALVKTECRLIVDVDPAHVL